MHGFANPYCDGSAIGKEPLLVCSCLVTQEGCHASVERQSLENHANPGAQCRTRAGPITNWIQELHDLAPSPRTNYTRIRSTPMVTPPSLHMRKE